MKINTLLSPLSQQIIATLAYSDVFDYPLNVNEIYLAVNYLTTKENIKQELTTLVSQKLVFSSNNFADNFIDYQTDYQTDNQTDSQENNEITTWFSLQNNENIFIKRKIRNDKAKIFLERAKKISQIIGKMPFVRSVMISGSLSKNCIDDTSDIDYFIITAPQKVWIVHSLLVFYRKFFLKNKKELCCNYTIDTLSLEMKHRTKYVATEITTVLPTFGQEIYHEFIKNNDWVKTFFPHFVLKENENKTNHLKASFWSNLLKKSIEKCLNNAIGTYLNLFLMRRVEKRWRKFHKDNALFVEEIISLTPNVAKGHGIRYHESIMTAFEDKIKQFEEKNSLVISLPIYHKAV